MSAQRELRSARFGRGAQGKSANRGRLLFGYFFLARQEKVTNRRSATGELCSLSMTPVLRRARTCIERDKRKRPNNPCVMSRKCLCSMCPPLGQVLDILCNPALRCKNRQFPVRAALLHRKLFARRLFRNRRHHSPACPERLELGYATRTSGTRLQSQRPIRSTSRFSSRLTALLYGPTYALSRARRASALERAVRRKPVLPYGLAEGDQLE